MAVELRFQEIRDARRFFDILQNPNFTYFQVPIKTLHDEEEFLRKGKEKREKNLEHNYTILYDGVVVGGCGIKINQHRTYIGEIGYFVDEAYWGKGIATAAVRLLERIGFEKLGVTRMEILMNPENKASEKVAIKTGYAKEGLMRKAINALGEKKDCWLYAKLKEDYLDSQATSSLSRS